MFQKESDKGFLSQFTTVLMSLKGGLSKDQWTKRAEAHQNYGKGGKTGRTFMPFMCCYRCNIIWKGGACKDHTAKLPRLCKDQGTTDTFLH